MEEIVKNNCDILIIGGGPAGTATASYLAQKGWDVVLFEKERYPRFHIGESLLPHSIPILKELDILEQVQDIGMIKYGVEFNNDATQEKQRMYFADALNKKYPYAFHVKRSEFDSLLFDNCIKKGANAIQSMKVTNIESMGEHHLVTAENSQGEFSQWQSKFVVDASGRETFFANKTKSKFKNPRHATAAIFTHFDKVPQLAGKDAGNISIYWFKHGWFWLIPFKDGSASIGVVSSPSYLKQRRSSLDEFFMATLQDVPQLATRVQNSKMTMPVTATGNYSYFNENLSGENWLTVGDACAFVDPVFSSGVHLALYSAKMAAKTIDGILTTPNKSAKFLQYYEKIVKRGLSQFTWLIYRMRSPVIVDMFMNPRNIFRIQEVVMSLLAGDVYENALARRRINIFKAIYYIKLLAHRRR